MLIPIVRGVKGVCIDCSESAGEVSLFVFVLADCSSFLVSNRLHGVTALSYRMMVDESVLLCIHAFGHAHISIDF